ncbi:bifunctional serine/threonine-protein kinase/universal stress protein [Piscinibacter sp.]|uniref:serine/threonine protein kinase n=1 Tax=Piscinibacter sp. TaxID=1903157 RepID=UPI001B7C4441|nr:bifunctional serine/threonine-protein kinase/universal stress protein [Piscinibacter sp.]MBK7530296.1 protein kinase [Piscinibacter sp.]MBP6541993.1 protein kinase [Piscinibacter sp.]HOY34189.1 bifunctional serine/threonine-protein kinase/universal stress protein [Piscinibacter sp.]HPG77812.1 bifunctional serine/threonine-protein kinase/universal stress protein [Piscinibacter sp.]
MANDDENTTARRLEAGQVIDGFRLEERTHQGGMANLWRVTRVEGGDGTPLMMKVPRIKGGDDPATIVGFEVEQMIMPTLSGPHVPKFIAKGDFTRQPYIVMEHVPGPSLRARFDAAPLPLDEVVQVGIKVATALHDLHRQHVVHLDVKPSNIMFRRNADGSQAEAVLVDFGLSRHDLLPDLLDEEFELPMGTGPYMSPEQVQFVRNDPRSDLFALGVLMYHLATGERPFGSPSTVRGLRQRLYREPVPPRALRADIPPWLQELILRCLEVKPEKRHQSAAQLAFELQHLDQVTLTERASRLARSGGLTTLKRWFSAVGGEPVASASAAEQAERSPILLAAVDVANATPALLEAVRHTAQRLLQTEPGARLACLAVMKTNRIATDELMEADGSSKHVNLLVQLKHWAHPLQRALDPHRELQAGRITYHVLEAPDAADAIVEYARKNQVDHVVMGARSSGGLRRYLGSVSAQVAAQCDCTVTVVRAAAED